MSAGGDDGRAVERTALAWQRTALALATVSALGTRLAVDRLGLLALGGLLGLPLSAWVFVRCGRLPRGTSSEDRREGCDGRGPSILTLAVALAALSAIAVQVLGPTPTP